MVPHRSTTRALGSLTSQIGRDVVLSAWYGRFHWCKAIRPGVNVQLFSPLLQQCSQQGRDASGKTRYVTSTREGCVLLEQRCPSVQRCAGTTTALHGGASQVDFEGDAKRRPPPPPDFRGNPPSPLLHRTYITPSSGSASPSVLGDEDWTARKSRSGFGGGVRCGGSFGACRHKSLEQRKILSRS